MSGHTVILRGQSQRDLAKRLIDAAPVDAVVNVKPPTRNKDQNALMWVLLGDISRAKPRGKRFTPDEWKARAMQALGWEVRFLETMDGNGFFPYGHSSSKLTKAQFSDLITFLYAFGDQEGIKWSNPKDAWEG